jgi:hypothetical protein
MKRITLLPVLVAAAIALQGCATGGTAGRPLGATVTENATVTVTVTTTPSAGSGPASDTSGSVTAPPSEPACTDVTWADPWIAFESPLTDGDELAVGERGWISGASSMEDVAVDGTRDAVRLSEQEAPTEIKCGTTTSTIRWIEVSAVAPGPVTITLFPGGSAATELRIRVTEV